MTPDSEIEEWNTHVTHNMDGYLSVGVIVASTAYNYIVTITCLYSHDYTLATPGAWFQEEPLRLSIASYELHERRDSCCYVYRPSACITYL